MRPGRAVVVVGVSHEELPGTESEAVGIAETLLQDHLTLGAIQVGLDNLRPAAPVSIEQQPEDGENC